MAKAKYWWISGTEDGLRIKSFSSGAELQEEIKDNYEGTETTPQFLSQFPERFDPETFQGEILIKGEVTVPRKVLTVTSWKVD